MLVLTLKGPSDGESPMFSLRASAVCCCLLKHIFVQEQNRRLTIDDGVCSHGVVPVLPKRMFSVSFFWPQTSVLTHLFKKDPKCSIAIYFLFVYTHYHGKNALALNTVGLNEYNRVVCFCGARKGPCDLVIKYGPSR